MPTTTGIATEFIQFTRASNATVTDSDGKIKWAPHNLLTNSESFASSPWATYNASIASNVDIAPNGTTTADRFTVSGVVPSVYVLNGVGSGQHSVAVFAKAGTSSVAGINVSTLGNGILVTFNMSTLATSVTTLGTGGTVSGGTASITAIGNGWFYCVLANVVTTGNNNVGFSIEGANGVTGLLWGAALYRSDLGGMQANTSAYPMYNPTTPKNLLGYTEDFSVGTWVRSGIAAFGSGSIANEIVAPNGLQTADRLVENTVNGEHYTYQQLSKAAVNGIYTISAYAKLGPGSRNVGLGITNGTTGGYSCVFNLTTNATTVAAVGVPTGFTAGTPTITPLSNSWFRLSFTVTTDTATRVDGVIYIANGTTLSYAGDGTSGIYIWGAQLSDSASLDTYSPVYGAAVTSAAYYGPRRDFDGATLACKGLLVEEQRTNLLLYSADFTQSPWYKVNATIAAATAPDGTSTAVTLTGTGAGGTLLRQDTAVSSATVDVSYYVKSGTATTCAIGDVNIGAVGVFNLSSGTVISGSGATILNAGGGWYRCSITYTAIGGFARQAITPGSTFSGTTTSSIVVWGAQCELGSFATSYIPTGASTVTRSADVASVSTQAFPYNQPEGTIIANVVPTLSIADNTRAVWFSGGGNRVVDIYISAGNWSFFNGTNFVNAGTPAASVGVPAKYAAAYKSGSYAGVLNGGAAGTAATTLVNTATNMYLGCADIGTLQLNGHIRQITYLPRRLSNTELQTRTT